MMPECSSAESDISNKDMEEVPEDPQRHLYDSDYMEEPEQEVGDELEVCSPNKVTKKSSSSAQEFDTLIISFCDAADTKCTSTITPKLSPRTEKSLILS